MRWEGIRDFLQSRLWPIPAAAIVVAVALGVFLPEVDRWVDPVIPDPLEAILFGGEPDSARAVLGAIAGSLITVTSLVFSLTILTLQLGSSQASPRLLRLFASNRRVHATLALFVGTFAYAMTVIPAVRSSPDEASDGFVPRIAVSLSFVLMLIATLALTLFLGHLASLLRVETMLRDVHREVTGTIRTLHGTRSDRPGGDEGRRAADELPDRPATRVDVRHSGFLTAVDRDRLTALAVREDLVIAIDRAVGAIVVEGTPIARWWSGDPARSAFDDARRDEIGEAIVRCLGIGYERTPVQDVGSGVRQLVDIALKAISPGVNDPTTAVHALGHVSAVLGDLVSKPVPSAEARDDDGGLRVVTKPLDLAALLDLATDQPRHYGAADIEVAVRLLRTLQEVAWRSIHPTLDSEIRAHADAVDEAARQAPRTTAELARLDDARSAVVSALAGEWREWAL